MSNVGVITKSLLRQPAFVVVAAILLIAAVSLNGATQFLQLHFRKLPVPPSRPLVELPEKLGPWLQVSIDEPLDADMEHNLGTDNYLFRDYVDTRILSPQDVEKFKDLSGTERKRTLAEIQMAHPEAVINMGLTYYTGMVDTVAHVPDRCFVADGYEPTTYKIENWSALKNTKGDGQVRFIVFEDQTPGRQLLARNVAYFFSCNGQFMNDPIGVRTELASLRNRYGYYMKIEAHMIKLPGPDAERVMNDFLTSAMPELQKTLPNWNQVTTAR